MAVLNSDCLYTDYIKSCIYVNIFCIALGVGLVGFTTKNLRVIGKKKKAQSVGIMMENTSALRLVVFVFSQAFVVSAALPYDPKPNPGSVVEVGQARFTVLTSNLIRMEWGDTNDAATFAFINRNLPTPQFNTSKDGDWTVIQTTAVTVRPC